MRGGGALIVGLALGAKLTGAGRCGHEPVRVERPGRLDAVGLLSRRARRQHRARQDRAGRDRPGLDDRAAPARRRGARHGRRPARLRPSGHERDARHRRDLRVELDRSGRAAGARAPVPPPARPCSRSASQQLGVPAANLGVSGGVVSGGGRSVTYGALVGGRLLGVAASGADPRSRARRPRSRSRPTALAGISQMPRLDIPAKVTGTYTYIHNVRVPGMLHGRLVRPLGQGAYGDGTLTEIVSIDERSIAGLGDARVVRRGDFAGVVASREYDAIQAAVAAEGRLPQSAGDLGEREPLLGDADARRRRARAAAHADPGGRCRRGDRRRRRTRSRGATPTTTRATCRSARAARSPT